MDKQIWQMALERLANDITPATYEWLRRGRLVATQNANKYILQVPSTAAQKQISKRFHAVIEQAVADVLGVKQVIINLMILASKHSAHQPTPDVRETLFPDVAPHAMATADVTETTTPSLAEALPVRAVRMANDQRRLRERRGNPTRTYTNGTPSVGPVATSAPLSTSNVRGRVAPSPSATSATEHAGESTSWLNDQYTFDTFVVGGGNQFAHAACMAVADDPGGAYNPLFLYGGVGLGKTHLMHSIAHAVTPKGCRTLYITSETFTNEIVNAIRYRTTEEFRAKYRSVDVLLVDDVQFIAGKDSTEEEFFHTFNTLHENRKQIVMCSDRPPREIDLEERLRSRFEWGLIADIQPPDLETRLAILKAKAEVSHPDISDAVLNYLAERVQTNVRALEGLLTRVTAFARVQKVPLTVELAKQALFSITPAEKPRRRIGLGEILVAVSTYYNVSIEDLRSKQRDKHIVMPRHVAMWLMRAETANSLMEIGMELGGRDHSTILHGCDKIEQEIRREDTALLQEIEAIRQQIAG